MSVAVEELLKAKKLRKTPLRVKVLEMFLAHSHSAIKTNKLESTLGEVDRITLYRTLKTFEKQGLIHKVMDGTQQSKYALCEENCPTHTSSEDHAHFLCDSCGETYCLGDFNLTEIAIPDSYKVNKIQLALSGTCPKCN